jgi:hypothetical protein
MSFTSTATTDTLSTPPNSPSAGRDMNSGQNQLRRRTHTLGVSSSSATSLNGSVSDTRPVNIKQDRLGRSLGNTEGYTEELAAKDNESGFNSGEELPVHSGVSPQSNGNPRASPKREEDASRIPFSQSFTSHSPVSSRSWYEFDLSVVVALVSPIGHWLTGGDHVKHLLLVLLLIFYLHQIIESKFSVLSSIYFSTLLTQFLGRSTIMLARDVAPNHMKVPLSLTCLWRLPSFAPLRYSFLS